MPVLVLNPSERMPRDAEIHDLRAAALEQHDVARLDVAVDDAALVREGEAVGDLQRDLDRLVGGQLAFLQARAQVRALEQLHRHEREIAFLAEVEDGDDVRVVELARRPRLLAKRFSYSLRLSASSVRRMVFSATMRSSAGSSARYTTPIAPRPSSPRIL